MRIPINDELRALLMRIEGLAKNIRDNAGYLDTGPGGHDATSLAKEFGQFLNFLEYLTEDTEDDREGPTR